MAVAELHRQGVGTGAGHEGQAGKLRGADVEGRALSQRRTVQHELAAVRRRVLSAKL